MALGDILFICGMDIRFFIDWKQQWADRNASLPVDQMDVPFLDSNDLQTMLNQLEHQPASQGKIRKLLLTLLLSQMGRPCSSIDLESHLLFVSERSTLKELQAYYEQLMFLQNSYPTLYQGAYKEFLPLHEQLFIYERYSPEDQFLIVLNFSARIQMLEQLAYLDIQSLLISSSAVATINSAAFSPWEGRIYELSR
ncbi:MAG: hypothetical protein AAF587_15665 [Bacteroidota bacterium]